MFQHRINAKIYPVAQLCVNTLPATKMTLITGGILFGALRFNDLYCSPNIVWVIKLRRMKWEGHVGRMGEGRGVFWWENLREKDQWGDPGVDGRIILRWIFRKWDVGYGLD
jgi:hypothetical protein